MSDPRFVGVHQNLALFENRGKSVLVNTRTLTASVVPTESVPDRSWKTSKNDPVWAEVASAELKRTSAPSTISLSESTKRTYTVPRRVSESAVSSARAEGKRSAVATHVASMLSSGEQLTCADVLWISRFFDNSAEGSTDRATWLAWGGSEGKRWSEGLASRLNYDSVIADAGSYDTPGVQAFVDGTSDERTFWAVLTEPEGRYASQLYKLTDAGTWQAWGNGDWLNCEEPALSPAFVELDEEAALYLAGALFDAPDSPIDLRTPNPEAWDLAEEARGELDYEFLDRISYEPTLRSEGYFTADELHEIALSAATEPIPNPITEKYTPEERSKNAQGQLRDANGRFADVGASGAIKSTGIGGVIEAANPTTQTVTVKGDDGTSYEVPASDFEVGAAPHPKVDPAQAKEAELDLEGIVADPKQPPAPRATLRSADLPILGPVQINNALEEYSTFITEARQEKSKEFKKLLEGPEEEVIQAAAESGVTVQDEVPEPTPNPTPDESDVAPVYLAIVAPDDPRAVMELVALVPSTAVSSEPKTFRRSAGKWVEDPKVLQDLRSATPPPVVQLDADQYQEVLGQVDMEGTNPPGEEGEGEQTITAAGILEKVVVEDPAPGDTVVCPGCGQTVVFDPLDGFQAEDGSVSHDDYTTHSDYITVVSDADDDLELTAAGGLDRNRGGAEKLRHYWTVGPGGLKIRWNTGGDWTRCVRLLSKHLGPRAKGYCALRHKEMTGMWPGDRRNREMSLTASGPAYSSDLIKSYPAVLRASAEAATAKAASARVFGMNGDPYDVVPENAEAISGSRVGKKFKIPLLIPEGLETGDGRTFGKGSLGYRTLPLPLMWQIKTGEGHDGSVLVGRIDKIERTEHGLGNARGVFDTGPYGQEAQRLVENKMLRWGSADLDKFEVNDGLSDPDNGKMHIGKGRLMGWTLVPKPAFQECTIELDLDEENVMPNNAVPSAIMASASIAAAIPVEPPSVWFSRPVLNGPTPLCVSDEGQVFGHIATWDRDHIGFNQSIRAPRSASNYSYFHTGVVRTADHKDVRVGQLTLAGGHAPINLNANLAVKHYDDTASAIADVHAGEDSYGIWVAGALRPGTTPEQIRALRASAPSGDWRAINHRLELVAICQVNVPGFPVPRSITASGEMTSLVAAGVGPLLAIRQEQEHSEQEALLAAARERVYRTLDIDGYLTEFKTFSEDKRKKLAGEGKALPDGSFPIENAADLRRAIHAYGRADEKKRAKVRRHIVKRARGLGKPEMIPASWKEASLTDKALSYREKYDSLVASANEKQLAALRDRVNPPSQEELASRVAALRSRIGE